MKKQEIGRFHATTFDEKVYEFVVTDNGRIECPMLCIKDAYRIVIKPRFELISEEQLYLSPARHGIVDGLIRDFDIDDDVFNYLKEHKMIMYSTDMAYLYGFNDKNGYDKKVKEGHPFKWAEKKGPILVKQKKGIFN